jgi:hypothetical protein
MLACLASVTPSSAAEYFTNLEIDQIRETQNVGRRIPLFLQIAEIRLTYLGLIETEEEIEAENPAGNFFERTLIRIIAPEAADDLERVSNEQPEFDDDVTVFSRADLLRGYYQAIEEAMDNIDDAYERRRGDVRGPLEDLKEFLEETLPLLRTAAPENLDEEIALEDAIEIAELARDGAAEALEIVPKTERQ